jgi:hypothetical protein
MGLLLKLYVVGSITVARSNPRYVDDHGAPSSGGSDFCQIWSLLGDALRPHVSSAGVACSPGIRADA